MAVAFRASSTGSNPFAATRTPTLAVPAGITDGDQILVVFVSGQDHTRVVPGGWSAVGTVQASGDNDGCVSIIRRTAASESGTWTFTNYFDAVEDGIVGCVAYSGAAATPNQVNQAAFATSGVTETTPSITPSVNNCMIIGAWGCDPWQSPWTGTIQTPPASGTSERIDANSGEGSGTQDGWLYVMDYLQGTAAAVTLAVAMTNANSGGKFIIALEESSGPVQQQITGTVAGAGTALGALSAGVTYMAAGAAATAASGNVTPVFPSAFGTLAVGDILVCVVSARDNVTVTVPGTWTKKAEADNGTGLRQTIAWKRRAGGDSDTDVLVTHTAGAQIIARVHSVRGCVSTGDPFEASTGPTGSAAAASGVFPNVTTVTAGALLFYAFAYQEDFTVAPAVTNAQGLTLTERDSTEVV